MKFFLAAVFLALCAATANADFIYNVDRTIGDGTVTGFIVTDGTLGVLNTSNITNWSLTLTTPNPDAVGVISDTLDSSNSTRTVSGPAVSATATQLKYDFSPSTDATYLLFMGNPSPYFWCLETIFCSGGADLSEQIGRRLVVGSEALQSVDYSGYTGEKSLVFATVVPVPAAVWLFASGLLGLVGFARRKR